jgi:hypothetical protein
MIGQELHCTVGRSKENGFECAQDRVEGLLSVNSRASSPIQIFKLTAVGPINATALRLTEPESGCPAKLTLFIVSGGSRL